MNDKVTTIFDHALMMYRTSEFDIQMKKLRNNYKRHIDTLFKLRSINGCMHIFQFDVIP